MDNYIISCEKQKLDVELIHSFLTKSYWATGRTLEEVKKSIEHSDCFGIYLEKKQVGFARILTDYITVAHLLDVFILKEIQGKGLGQKLIETILNHSKYSFVKKWILATKDAHNFYRKFNFNMLSYPERLMEKRQ